MMRNVYKFTFLILISLGGMAQVAPTATIIGTSNLACVGIPVTFASLASHSNVTYKWAVVPAIGLSRFSDLTSHTLSLTFTASTTYTVLLFVTDSTKLTSSTQTLVPVAKMPKSSFNASLIEAGYPNRLVLTNYSTNQVSNEWRFSDAPNLVDVATNTSKNYNGPGSYTVALIAKGLRGCNDSTKYAFRISDSSGVTLPNIFSPNGDGVNDLYKPITKGIHTLKGYVYNRYSTLIHSWDKVNGFWDGYTTSGLPCSAGEYFVIVEAYGFDNQVYKLKSLVTLVR